MRTFFIDKQDIVRITGERFYKRGYDYYKKGRVFGLSYNPTINSWRGQVKGTETYSVRIFFFEDDELEGSCDCPAYATHFTCKHIAAVLLAIGQDSWDKLREDHDDPIETSVVPQQKDTFTTRMIDAFRSDPKSSPGKQEQIVVEYTIGLRINPHNSKSFLEVELKLGTKKTYIIKNIRELLLHIKKAKVYKITPTFSYDPSQHYFTEDDQDIIHALITAYDSESLYENSFSNPLQDKRTITLQPSGADEILEILSRNENCYYKGYDGEINRGIKITDNINHLHFLLDQDEDDSYTIDISPLSSFTYLENYHYLFKQGIFYKIQKEQQSIMEQLFSLLPYRTKQAHTIPKDKINPFVADVVPKLEAIGKVKFTEKTKDKVVLKPLEAKVYLDESRDTLTAKLSYQYGDTIIEPFSKSQQSDKIIKRDSEKENEIQQLLQKSGFTFLNGQFQLFNNAAIYQFLQETLSVLQEKATVYTSTQVKAMIGGPTRSPLVSTINLDQKSGMLDIYFDMDGISEKDIQNVLQAMVEKKNYYRIPNGALLSLEEEEYQSFYQLADQLQLTKKQIEDGHLQLPAARSFQVEEALNAKSARYSESFQRLLTELKQPSLLDFSLPSSINAELRDYQLVGFQWLKSLSHYHLGGILADDMGLGKTLQTISYLVSEMEERDSFRGLVVAPASLLYNWKKEFEKFAPHVRVCVATGTRDHRQRLIESSQDVDIFITSYPTLRQDIDLYEKSSFDALILDEAQAIKNHLTQTAKAVRSLQATKKFALSGTPIENSLEELWSIFYTVSPGLFGNKKSFLNLEPAYIAKITRPFILRRVKKDVLEELPDKIETVQYSDLTKNQKEVYLAYLEQMQEQLKQTIQEKGFERGKLEILAGLTRLRQICCHPSLFLENYTGKSGKLEQLKELLEELKQNGKRTLIFSQFSSMLSMINGQLEKEGYETFYLDGSTPSAKRMEMVDAFNEGEKSVFLISLKAGGTGLNLTGADTVILYDLWWNPAIEEQAAGRAHRIGQKNVVQVIRLITEGTIEEKIYELQQKKRELVDQIIQPGETMLSKLSEKEIRELLQVKV
ncbi:DEAD/DEAH box helicase [Aquibacillus kalidii]|uniref:DEAD/DEAH box helicase n=1 Tax=Aquibacillus kalidii TaxID=2762597 RepID=UPI0016474677|nr:DEAD/DEAH box helicase [Aquibacillus kalidii]